MQDPLSASATSHPHLQGLLASQPHVDLVAAGDHSLVQEECKACAISLFQADTLPEGLHWRQLSDPAGGLYLVRGEPSSLMSCHHMLCAV